MATPATTMSNLFERFRRFRPPTFAGTYRPEEAEYWLNRVTKLLQPLHCSKAESVEFLSYLFKKEADLWWEATVIAFFGPIKDGLRKMWPSPESLASPPEWFELDSSVAVPSHETAGFYRGIFSPDASGFSILDRLVLALQRCSAMAIRSCNEFQVESLGLLKKLHKRPVIPIGLLPPTPLEKRETTDPKWYSHMGNQRHRYPSAGIREPDWQSWVVYMGWAPQLEILAHPSIGGSLFHSGWASTIETIHYGHALIILPLANVHSLDAKMLVDKGLAIKVEINEDGSFHRDAVVRSLRRATVKEDGERFRLKSIETKAIFSDQTLHQNYMNEFINFLKSSN
ncbi:UDP-glycosyltransferase 91C1-like [Magnolia sinica]|uniref:UDP-glycosyltransferase 91C1-like n=1 Tax=Magnolia sinica TaxID=86752 RepID=UPI002659994F|nr:UDP-glycosyltransferase 91C1-like [Magnolia sinica]